MIDSVVEDSLVVRASVAPVGIVVVVIDSVGFVIVGHVNPKM